MPSRIDALDKKEQKNIHNERKDRKPEERKTENHKS